MCVLSVGAHVPATTWQGRGECVHQNNDLPKISMSYSLEPENVFLDKGELRLQI